MPRLFALTLLAGLFMTNGAMSEPSQTGIDKWLSCRGLKLVTTLNTALAPLPNWEPRQQTDDQTSIPSIVIRVSTTPMPRLKTTPNL